MVSESGKPSIKYLLTIELSHRYSVPQSQSSGSRAPPPVILLCFVLHLLNYPKQIKAVRIAILSSYIHFKEGYATCDAYDISGISFVVAVSNIAISSPPDI